MHFPIVEVEKVECLQDNKKRLKYRGKMFHNKIKVEKAHVYKRLCNVCLLTLVFEKMKLNC